MDDKKVLKPLRKNIICGESGSKTMMTLHTSGVRSYQTRLVKRLDKQRKNLRKKLHKILKMIRNLFIRMRDQKLRFNPQLDH